MELTRLSSIGLRGRKAHSIADTSGAIRFGGRALSVRELMELLVKWLARLPGSTKNHQTHQCTSKPTALVHLSTRSRVMTQDQNPSNFSISLPPFRALTHAGLMNFYQLIDPRQLSPLSDFLAKLFCLSIAFGAFSRFNSSNSSIGTALIGPRYRFITVGAGKEQGEESILSQSPSLPRPLASFFAD